MTKSIDFYFDFISPYSYLAHKQIENIKQKNNINFNYKPILVGGLHKLQGILDFFYFRSFTYTIKEFG